MSTTVMELVEKNDVAILKTFKQLKSATPAGQIITKYKFTSPVTCNFERSFSSCKIF